MNDRKFFLLAIALENATQEQLNRLTTTISQLFAKYTRGGVITDSQALTQAIQKEISSYYDVFVDQLYESTKKVGDLRAKEAIEDIIPLLTKAGLYSEAITLYRQVQNYGDQVAKRLMVDGWAGKPLGFTIKTIKAGTQKTVQNIIANGVAEGKGSKLIAKDIIQYVNPAPNSAKGKPYDEYRKRFGRPKSFTPEGIPMGTVQFNAMRIARTETAHIYRQATVDFYDDKEYIKGYSWNLSNRHPEEDICDEYARKTYKTSDAIPTAHPHCLCDVRPIVMTRLELKALRDKKYSTATTTSARKLAERLATL